MKPLISGVLNISCVHRSETTVGGTDEKSDGTDVISLCADEACSDTD